MKSDSSVKLVEDENDKAMHVVMAAINQDMTETQINSIVSLNLAQ